MADFNKIKVSEVLVDSGDGPFELKKGTSLSEVIRLAATILDAVYLNNVLLLRGSDGRYYFGEFLFELRPVSAKEAKEIAKRNEEAS